MAFTCLPAAAASTDSSGVMATINHAIAAFNKSDMKGWVAQCSPPTIVIDDFPPHTWAGATACSDWWSAYAADSKANGRSDGMVAIGRPWHVNITGSYAYVVTPATYTYKQQGKSMSAAGVFTLVLKKGAGGWLITGWSWADH